ncbi:MULTISPECIES: hypothetical protein [unclassified Exiguobacterium]|uniref:hypothetical protein n=1 Tax=unclassified Exiguobacterium TaxID=2644629 RepID=UPI001BEA567C|nr:MULTISPECIES: hypothetical protein [unclassified Exiguobacterium]
MAENKQPSRSALLEQVVQGILKEKLGAQSSIQFTRNDIIEELSKTHKDEESLFTGVLNRLFEKDDRIKKVARGVYELRVKEDLDALDYSHVIKVLDDALGELDALSTNVTIIEGTVFTERDREVIACFSQTIKKLKGIKKEVEEEVREYWDHSE